MFKIVEITPPYQPIEKNLPSFYTLEEFNSNTGGACDTSHSLYIAENVWIQQIGRHINWGGKSANNIVEQGGLLLGHTYYDVQNNLHYGIVTKAILGDLAVGNPAYLEMNHDTWKAMLDAADNFIDNTDTDLQVIGWYHTHPNNLSVFMSGTDMGTQRAFFNKDWQFAIVINPHQQIWRAFFGNQAHECAGYIYSGAEEKKYFTKTSSKRQKSKRRRKKRLKKALKRDSIKSSKIKSSWTKNKL